MENSTTSVLEQTNAQETSKSTTTLLTVVAGLLLVYVVGLAAPVQLHNAAHDVRHSVAFPCH
ncbi:MAG: CbtB-domain containing protein [Campylobacteraceae bacterium]|nr:CbtB-domain containing protein [Campylobacteraceae bacterium]